MRDLIFVSLEDWDKIWRRNQFLCAEMVCRHPEMRIIFVNLPKNAIKSLLRGQVRALLSRSTWKVATHPRITLTHSWEVFPNRFAWGRRLNEWLVRRHVRKLAGELGFREVVLWLNPHDSVHMAGRMDEAAVVYDITDDWTQMTQSDAQREHTIRRDTELCRKADAVIVCSQALFQRRRHLTGNLHLVPNGVDANHYRMVSQTPVDVDANTVAWPKPVLGYTGTLHADRIDVALVRELAESMQSGSIVLVGPNHLPPADLDRLRHPKIFLIGAVSYEQIPEYMRNFDVCIVPHLVTPFTESLNPIKLWEYLAAGKPIISTRVAGFRDYPDFVYLADNCAGFVAALRVAFAESPSLVDQRRDEASRHSWSVRLDTVEAIIAGCLAREKASPALV